VEIETHKVQFAQGWPAPENIIVHRLNLAKHGHAAEPSEAKLDAQFRRDSLRQLFASLKQRASAVYFKL
jgi:hypothetical protein